MKRISKNISKILIVVISLYIFHSCGIYSFSGTSIQPDVKTVTINYFDYKALTVDPNLSQLLTETLKTKFKRMTNLKEVDIDGDLEIEGTVTGYDVTAMAVTAEEVASQNRLTVTVSVKYTNRKYPEENFTKTFSGYADYDSTKSLDSVQGTLTEEITEKICEDIFNATVANW